jgi:hypothetical protein
MESKNIIQDRNKYRFEVAHNGKIHTPKGLYYQDKNVILVGCTKANHTIRLKLPTSECKIRIYPAE